MAQVALNSLQNGTEAAGNIFQKVSNKVLPRNREEKRKEERAGDLGLGNLTYMIPSLGHDTEVPRFHVT